MAKTKKNFTKKSQKRTHVAIVLDRSGSMTSIHKQTVDGINEQLKSLRDTADDGGITEVTLIQFDDVIEKVFEDRNAKEMKEWGFDEFQPRGYTAMRDGIWSAINHLKTKDDSGDVAFLVCVISDGGENASKEVTQADITKEIERLQNTGKWTFTYLLANVDVRAVANMYAASAANAISYISTPVGASAAYACNASAVGEYMRGSRKLGLTSTANFYSKEDVNNLTKGSATVTTAGTATGGSTTFALSDILNNAKPEK